MLKQGADVCQCVVDDIELPDAVSGNPVLRQIIMSVKGRDIIRRSASDKVVINILLAAGRKIV